MNNEEKENDKGYKHRTWQLRMPLGQLSGPLRQPGAL